MVTVGLGKLTKIRENTFLKGLLGRLADVRKVLRTMDWQTENTEAFVKYKQANNRPVRAHTHTHRVPTRTHTHTYTTLLPLESCADSQLQTHVDSEYTRSHRLTQMPTKPYVDGHTGTHQDTFPIRRSTPLHMYVYPHRSH